MAGMKKKTATKKAPRPRGKMATAKAVAAKAKPAGKRAPAGRGAVRPARKPPSAPVRPTASRPKARSKARRPATRASGQEMSWGAMVDTLNARVAIRMVAPWELVRLTPAPRELPPPLLRAANIDSAAPDGVRAIRFLAMARACVADLHSERPLAARENMARFLLHTAWHGSRLRQRRGGLGQPGDGLGAARGVVPFEAHRAKDTLVRLARAPGAERLAYRLGELANLGWPGLVRAAHSLPDWGHGGRGAAFPDGHIVEGLLERNDQFALYLARAAFLLIPPAVPIGNTNHAEYWFTYWRISAADPDAERLAFRTHADEVDSLIDG